MMDLITRRHRTMHQFPRDDMGLLGASTNVYLAISIGGGSPSPAPTPIRVSRAGNMFPESLSQRSLEATSVRTPPTTKSCPSRFYNPVLRRKLFSASFADSHDVNTFRAAPTGETTEFGREPLDSRGENFKFFPTPFARSLDLRHLAPFKKVAPITGAVLVEGTAFYGMRAMKRKSALCLNPSTGLVYHELEPYATTSAMRLHNFRFMVRCK
jgi:hypothetical protein